MKNILILLLCLFALVGFGQSTNKTPINRGFLQTDLNGNTNSATNLNVVQATTFKGDGSQLTGIGAASQTPWAQNINGQGNILSNSIFTGAFTGNTNLASDLQTGLMSLSDHLQLSSRIGPNENQQLNFGNAANIFVGRFFGNGTNQTGTAALTNLSNGNGSALTGFTASQIPALLSTNITDATSANTASTIVKRDSSGNFSAGTITANLTGNASGSAASFTGNLSGNVTGTQSATVVSSVGSAALPAAQVTGSVALANGGTGGTNQVTAQANIESPIFVRVCGPAVSAGYALDVARTGEGVFVEYSYDGINWQSLFPDGRNLYTNLVGLHDPGLFINPTNGLIYVPFTFQSQSVFTVATNAGLIQSSDWINWTPVGTGAININTNAGAGVSWAPDIIQVNNRIMLYETIWNGAAFDGKIVALVASNSDLTLWTSASNAIVIVTNEAATVSGGPYTPSGNGVNDSFGFLFNQDTIITNSAGQSGTVTNGTYGHFVYNYNTAPNYDLYTNAQNAMPTLCHLFMTNVTAFALGVEGGQVKQMATNIWRWYGSVGTTGSPKTKGRYFYSDCTNVLGNFTQVNFCNELPRATFGQSTVLALTGANRIAFEKAIAIAAGTRPNPFAGASAIYSVRRIPGHNGPAMDVRRSSDNLVTTIGFLPSGDLDTNTLLAFAGTGNALVTAWYDQSGNGNNAVQLTNASQPTIVASGLLKVDQNGLPTIAWASPDSLETVNGVSVLGGFSIFGYVGRNWNTAAYACIMESADYTVSTGWGFTDSAAGTALGWTAKSFIASAGGFQANGNNLASTFALPNAGFLNVTNNGVFYEIEANVGVSNSGVWIGGTSSATTIIAGPALSSVTNVFIGGNPNSGGTDYQDGNISEIILFPAPVLAAQQQALRGNINSYYTGTRPLQSSNVNTLFSTNFAGNGGNITNLNATELRSGSIADARLSANVALLNGTGPQTFTGSNSFAGITNTGGLSVAGGSYHAGTNTLVGANFTANLTATTITANTSVTSKQYLGKQSNLGGATAIDWSAFTDYYTNIASSVTFTFANNVDTETLSVAITGDASHTVAWPGTVKWQGAATPVQTLSKTDLYFFKQVNGTVYGIQQTNY